MHLSYKRAPVLWRLDIQPARRHYTLTDFANPGEKPCGNAIQDEATLTWQCSVERIAGPRGHSG